MGCSWLSEGDQGSFGWWKGCRMVKGNGWLLGELGGVIGRRMMAGKDAGLLGKKEEDFLKIPEEKGGGLGVENALGLRLLSGMLKTPSDTLFCCSLLSRIGR